MLTLFHPFPTRVDALIGREISAHGWRLETSEMPLTELSLFDSVNRQLLSGGLILEGDLGSVRLHDAEGSVKWAGPLSKIEENGCRRLLLPETLEELIGSRLDEWLLVEVAQVKLKPTIMAGFAKKSKKSAARSSVSIQLSSVICRPVSGLPTEGMLIEIAENGDTEGLGRQLMGVLCDSGGIACPWPLMLMVQRAAAATGWIDSERMWNGRDKWADVVRVLVQLLRGIRDEIDPACVLEARKLLNNLRILIDLGRKLQGKLAKPEKHRGLKNLRDELTALRSLDLMRRFLAQTSQNQNAHWSGAPGIIADSLGWTDAHAAALFAEIEARRIEELQNLRATNRYISDPDTIIELSATWPPFPQFEKPDSLVRGRWQANLENRIRKLVKDIAAIDAQSGNPELWLEIRRRCRKIGRVMDACSDWADHKELRFFRRMTGVWYKRLAEYEAMQSNLETLGRIAAGATEPLVREAAIRLAEVIKHWLTAANSQLCKTVPALALSARNARRKLA